jgi:hypothetical protein
LPRSRLHLNTANRAVPKISTATGTQKCASDAIELMVERFKLMTSRSWTTQYNTKQRWLLIATASGAPPSL